MADMQELIARLEAAEAGSRELDREIGEVTRAPMGNAGDVVGLGYAHFTTSLEAALALAERVLPGWVWMVEVHRDGSSTAWLSEFNAYGEGEQVLGNSPALALCIAILKAKAQGEGNG